MKLHGTELKVGDRVWDNNCNSHNKQHFKEFGKNGKIECFDNGKTSFTAYDDNDWSLWDNWELYEEKDV